MPTAVHPFSSIITGLMVGFGHSGEAQTSESNHSWWAIAGGKLRIMESLAHAACCVQAWPTAVRDKDQQNTMENTESFVSIIIVLVQDSCVCINLRSTWQTDLNCTNRFDKMWFKWWWWWFCSWQDYLFCHLCGWEAFKKRLFVCFNVEIKTFPSVFNMNLYLPLKLSYVSNLKQSVYVA